MDEFVKLNRTPKLCFIPLWTIEELNTILRLYGADPNGWKHRFEYLEGVLRLVLEKTEEESHVILQKEVTLPNSAAAIKADQLFLSE